MIVCSFCIQNIYTNSHIAEQCTICMIVTSHLSCIEHFISDIDECEEEDMATCSQVCMNEPGTYRCGCYSGFVLGADRQSCTGKL